MTIISTTPRTDREIVDQTNDLARICLAHLGTGYEAPEGHKFYEAGDARSKAAWQRACQIMEHLTATDASEALLNLEDEVEVEHEYLLDCDVKVAIRLKARSAAEARKMVDDLINCATVNFGTWPNGEAAIGEATCHARSIGQIDGIEMENARAVYNFEAGREIE